METNSNKNPVSHSENNMQTPVAPVPSLSTAEQLEIERILKVQ